MVKLCRFVRIAAMGKRGRPVAKNAERLRLTIRLSESRKQAYERAAAKAEVSVSAWIRATLDSAAKRTT